MRAMTRPGNSERPPALDAAAFTALYQRLRRATPWGPDDRRGALNYITPARVLAAAGEVRQGRTVTLEAPIETQPAPDNPEPARDDMTGTGDQADPAGLSFAMDRLTMNVHGNADSHIDALCHVMYRARLYNDVPADTVTSAGADELSIELARNGIVGRGVLLDIPRLHGIPWLEPGDHVTADDLTQAEKAQGVRVGEGDLLFVRVGHRERRNAMGPWDSAASRAGMHPAAMEFVAERKVAALGSDSNNDTAPSAAEGVDFPVHVLALNAMGLHLLDWLQFDDLVPLCAETGRWSFLCVIAPLRLVRGTGSPVNPVAIL
jgi:kynurenine formamidase